MKSKTMNNSDQSTHNIEALIKRAERHAAQAKCQAIDVEKQAGKIELSVKACIHKATVELERAKNYGLKANLEPELKKKYLIAADIASSKKNIADQADDKAERKSRSYSNQANCKKKKAQEAERNGESSRAERLEARQANNKANEIIASTAEIRSEARKAETESKKAKLEWEESLKAIELEKKHSEAAAAAEDEGNIYKSKAEDLRLEAQARRNQLAAKEAEIKALKAGKMNEAEAFNLKSREEKARAVAQHAIIKEKRNREITQKKKTEQPGLKELIDQPPNTQARFVEKKHLSAAGLLSAVHDAFGQIPDIRQGTQGKTSEITLCDSLMSGVALFGLKYPSLLQFNNDSQEGGCIHHNLRTLYKIKKVPSDTYMRERLDNVDPITLRPVFKMLHALLQRGKGLEKFTFLDEYYLVAGDGTGYFSSNTVHCDNCCTKHHQDGRVTYYHQMMSATIVHPDQSTVIPFCPEAVINKDGSTKNDCERNASERLYRHIRREHPHLPIIITEDALGSNGPHILLLKELNMRCILVVKSDGNKSLFEFLKGIERQKYTNSDESFDYIIEFVNNVPLNDAHQNLLVNFFEVFVYDKKSKKLDYHNSWITDIPITTHNVYRLYQGGRAKWKIENETFNTLKNQGYEFEHNFGHGKNNLSVIMALLMFLAFFVDQIQQLCCGQFQAAWKKMQSKVRLWGRMRAYFTTLHIESWEKMWQALAFGLQGNHLLPATPLQDTS